MFRLVYSFYFMASTDLRLGLALVGTFFASSFCKKQLRAARFDCGKVDQKLRKNLDHLFDEDLDMMSTIKQFSREAKHLAEFRSAKDRVVAHLGSVVYWRNANEF